MSLVCVDFKGIDFIVENYFEEHVLPMEQVAFPSR